MSLGAIDKGELSLKALSGKGAMGQKGLLDLALRKFHLNRLCLSTIMDALWADAKAKEEQAALEAEAAARAAVEAREAREARLLAKKQREEEEREAYEAKIAERRRKSIDKTK